MAANVPAFKTKNLPLVILKVSELATEDGTATDKVNVIVPIPASVEISVMVLLNPILAAVPDKNSICLSFTFPLRLKEAAATVTVVVEPPLAV